MMRLNALASAAAGFVAWTAPAPNAGLAAGAAAQPVQEAKSAQNAQPVQDAPYVRSQQRLKAGETAFSARRAPPAAPSLKSLPPVSPPSSQSGPLLLDDVLRSSAAHFPTILQAFANERAAAGDVLTADGAFDLVFAADGFDRVSGVWTGRVVNTELRQNLRPLGGTLYGGYRRSDGFFPIYENVNFTNTGGELKVGAIFSLLRDRAIDDRRFRTADARLALEQAELDSLLTHIGVQHRAILAYWRWVIAGRQLDVYDDLLRIAEQRQAGLEEQVRRGAIAEIFLAENLQNIMRRQRLATQARRDFMTAANALSMFYRDAAGSPLIPQERRLPPDEMLEPISALDIGAAPPIADALAQRPELARLRVALDRARRRIELNRNELQPRFDVRAEVSHDLGDIAEGGSTFDSTDAIVGFRFSVPFQRSEARGRLQKARAEAEALTQRRREAMERMEIELRNILIDLDVSLQVAAIAEGEVEQALIMQRAENQRFAQGASDFFLVNVREETAADTRIRLLAAELESRIARANYDAATVNLDRLGEPQ